MADGMGQREPGRDEDGEDGAERAFEGLRAEVAAQRRALERLDGLIRHGQREAAASAPDYSPTLGTIVRELRGVGGWLEGIEAHPALRLTPEQHALQVAAGVREAREEASRGMKSAGARLEEAVRELRGIVGAANDQLAQRRREYIAVAIGAGLGFVLWWPLTQVLPWGGGNRLAATLIDGGGRWEAGRVLMREEDPRSWERMARLYRACPQDSATELCEAALAVRTIPPGQPPTATEQAKTVPAARTPAASPNRVGQGQ